jgi:hypothetical protein
LFKRYEVSKTGQVEYEQLNGELRTELEEIQGETEGEDRHEVEDWRELGYSITM